MAKLVVMFPGGRRKNFPIDRPQLVLGRSEGSNIPLPAEPKASRKHLVINFIANVITVEDQDSANGTWFNGEKINRRTIKDRDILTIGDTRIQFLYDDNAEPDRPKAKRKKLAATIDKTRVIEFLPNGNWAPVQGSARYIELLDGEYRGLKIAMRNGFSVGRSALCELILEGKRISHEHAQFEEQDEICTVKDLESTNGTYVNTAKLDAQKPYRLKNGDVIEIGEQRMVFRVPPELRRPESGRQEAVSGATIDASLIARHALLFVGGPMEGQRANMSERVTIGRHTYNTLSIQGGNVSNYHAEVVVSGKDFLLRDLQSTNGTYVNGKPVKPKKPVKLKHGDVISIGDHVMVFEEAGIALDMEARVARIQRKAREKVALALIQGLCVLAFAIGVVFFAMKPLKELIAPAPAAAAIAVKPYTTVLPELSFELTDPAKQKIWAVLGWQPPVTVGQSVGITYQRVDVRDGTWALDLVPEGGTDARSSITLTTSAEVTTQLGAVSRNAAALEVSLSVKPSGLRGQLGMRVIWYPQAASRGNPVTVRWVEASELKDGEWNQIKGKVLVPPRGVENFGLEVFVNGTAKKLTLDELVVKPVSAEGESYVTPAIDPLDRIGIKFDTAAKWSAVVGKRKATAVDSAEPVLLTRNEKDGSYRVFQRASEGGPISVRVSAISAGDREFGYQIFAPRSGKVLPFTEKVSRRELTDVPSYYLVEMTLVNVDLKDGEILAMEFALAPGALNNPNRLTLFNAAMDEIALPTQYSGLVSNVAELTWGTNSADGDFSMQFNPPARLVLDGDRQRVYVIYAVGGERRKDNPELFLRAYSNVRKQAVDSLMKLAKDLSQDRTLGDALLVYRHALSRYDGFMDYGDRIRAKMQEIERIQLQYLTAVESAVDSLRRLPLKTTTDAAAAVGFVNAGLAAADHFKIRFRALTEDMAKIEQAVFFLRERNRQITQFLQAADQTNRLRQAQQLQTLMRAAFNENSAQYSTIRARMFAEEIINSYPDCVEAVQAAKETVSKIQSIWLDPKAPEIAEAEIKKADDLAMNGKWASASETLRRVLTKWPNSPLRIDMQARRYWWNGITEHEASKKALGEAKVAQEQEAVALFKRAVALLPEPAGMLARNSPRQMLRLKIEKDAVDRGITLR